MSKNEDWSFSHSIHKKTGVIKRTYRYKNKACHSVILDSKLSNQLAGYSLIEKDLRNILVWLGEIKEMHTEASLDEGGAFFNFDDRKKYNLIKGLFVVSITFYGKCFSKCEGRPVKLERAQIPEEFRDLHDTCIKYRHNFAAHSGAEQLESADIALVMPSKIKSLITPLKIFTELNQPDLVWPAPGELTLIELVEAIRSFVSNKIDLLTSKIIKEEVLPKGYEYWRAK